jgi:heme/copper-type cytochrome/quinol oxidase subunit 1
MLPAKLFATLAVLQATLALFFALVRSRTLSLSMDVFLHATYYVIGRVELMGLAALISACFALIYFAASRWVLRPLKNSLGIAHFVFALIGFALLFAHLLLMRSLIPFGDEPVNRSLAFFASLAFFVGGFSFFLGCATLAVNCAWTAIAVFRRTTPKRA